MSFKVVPKSGRRTTAGKDTFCAFKVSKRHYDDVHGLHKWAASLYLPVERTASCRERSDTAATSLAMVLLVGSCVHWRTFAMEQTECLLKRDLRLAAKARIWGGVRGCDEEEGGLGSKLRLEVGRRLVWELEAPPSEGTKARR